MKAQSEKAVSPSLHEGKEVESATVSNRQQTETFMTASFARYLPDFEFSGMNGIHAGQHQDDASRPAALPSLDIESIRAEARAEGEAEARAELTRQFEAEHLAIEDLHAAELVALREELETLAAKTIPDIICARNAQIAEQIASDVEAVLAPLVDQTVRKNLLDVLSGEIRKALALETAEKIHVRGPAELVAALGELVEGDPARLVVHETDGFDIEVDVDNTRFSSRLSEWSRVLAEALT
ncbi:hypothetical protein PZ897_18135 [Hoeflea sp. YIM 152468]|uniref:hypothetical protein n=1 Tax=Hoeflea sp. YIM 152468 TaxID=3031759 RepID=UPI0023DB6282|nr:hypothetical protein [Hoeflea sp. YIM 152468]MDF1610105.1 hypothetical protein [Hoeflea sp. YIM 152468]